MAAVTLLLIAFPCPSCTNHPDSQPNYCRKCGGSGNLRKTITHYQLGRMGDIPEVLGATIRVTPNPQAGKQP